MFAAALAKPGEPKEELAGQLARTRAVEVQLLADLPADRNEWTDEHHGRWLLAQMLEWHRREEKSGWWEYFRLCELSDTEIEEDKSALGGLSYVGEVGRVKRSAIQRYRFPPQDYAVDRAYEVHDPKTQKSAGDFVAIDELNLTIDLKRVFPQLFRTRERSFLVTWLVRMSYVTACCASDPGWLETGLMDRVHSAPHEISCSGGLLDHWGVSRNPSSMTMGN
jgi:hypothetical protein